MPADKVPANIATAYLAAMAVIVIWGAMPAATRIAVDEIDPISVASIRSIVAAILLIPILLITRAPLPSSRAAWGALAVSALAGFVVYQMIFAVGIAMTSTSHAALILAAAPIFTGIFGFIVERQWPAKIWWAGAAVAMIGEVVLILSKSGSGTGTATLSGDLVLLFGTILVGATYVAGGRLSLHIGAWPAIGWSLVIAGFILLPVLGMRLEATDWAAVTPLGWAGVLYLAIVSSILGYAGWYWALGRAGAARIAPVQFAQPLVSLVIAVAVLSEAVTVAVVTATALILAGIALTRYG